MASEEKREDIQAPEKTQIQVDEARSELSMLEEFQFTWRAAIIGSLLGCFVAASNMYLGLKIGWSFGASLFGAIFSFAIIKPMSRVLPLWLGGGYFGPKENCTAQSAATTAGGLSAGFVSGIPAMYKLGLLSADPMDDIAALILWTLSAAFYGLFFAIPLRKHFVVKQDLVFPTPRASAETIKSLHNTVDGEKEAMKKAYWMLAAFGLAFVWTLLAFFVPVFDTIHWLYFIGTAVGNANIVAADQVWRWWFTFDFPFFGAGLMTPGATVFSMFAGQLIAFGIAGPLMLTNGSLINGFGFTDKGPTAQSWFLWPGISLMVFSSFTELFIRYDVLWLAIKGGCIELVNIFRRMLNKDAWADAEDDGDPVPKHEQVPLLWWGTGLIVSIIFTCVIMGVMFGMPVYQSLVAIILSFLLSFIGLQASGQTDINPIGSIGKVTQLVFAKMPADTLQHVQKNNLMAGNMAASAAAQSVDMVGDLKTGHLLGASPRSQFLAQLVGSVFAVIISVALFILYAKAYPCVTSNDPNLKCAFGLTAVTAWQKVTEILTTKLDIPQSSIYFTIACGIIGIIGPVVRHFFVPEKFHDYYPNFNAIGIGFINTLPEIPLAMVIGWIASTVWRRTSPNSWTDYMYSIAGGLIAGQGISAVIQAILNLSGGAGYVTGFSCYEGLIAECP